MNIPDSWGALVRSIREVCPTAVLAGGALRDLDNAREVKDLDIFIFADSDREAFGHIDALNAGPFSVSFDETFEGGKAYPEDQNLEVIQIADLLDHDLPVQLIFVRWPTDRIVERFDYGICQLAYDGSELTKGEHYEADKAAQVFQLRRDRPTPVSMRGSVRRYARLTAEKYAGWDWAPYGGLEGLEVFDAFLP